AVIAVAATHHGSVLCECTDNGAWLRRGWKAVGEVRNESRGDRDFMPVECVHVGGTRRRRCKHVEAPYDAGHRSTHRRAIGCNRRRAPDRTDRRARSFTESTKRIRTAPAPHDTAFEPRTREALARDDLHSVRDAVCRDRMRLLRVSAVAEFAVRSV